MESEENQSMSKEELEVENKRLKNLLAGLTQPMEQMKNQKETQEPLVVYVVDTFLIFTIASLLLAIYQNRLDTIRNIIILITYIPWVTMLLGDDILYNLFGKESYIYYSMFTIIYQFYYIPWTYQTLYFIIPGGMSMVIAALFYGYSDILVVGTRYPETPAPFRKLEDGLNLLLISATMAGSIIATIWLKVYGEHIFAILTLAVLFTITIRINKLSTTYNNLNQMNSITMLTFLTVYILPSYLIFDWSNYLSYILPITSTIILLVGLIFWIQTHPSNIEGSVEERTIVKSLTVITKLLFNIIKTETFSTCVIVFSMYIIISLITKPITNYEIELTDNHYVEMKQIYQSFINYYPDFIRLTEQSWFKTTFFPIIKDVDALKSVVKNTFLKGGYPLYVIGNGVHDSIIISDDLYLMVQIMILLVINFLTLFKFYKPVLNIFKSELYWLVLIVLDIVLITSISSAGRLKNILILSTNDTRYNEYYTKDGVLLIFILSLLLLFYFRHLISISMINKKVDNQIDQNDKKGFAFEFKNGVIGFSRQFFRISNILFIFGLLSLVFLSFIGSPINQVNIINSNSIYVPDYIQNAVNQTNLLEGKLIEQLPKKLVNYVWLIKGVTYATDQIPCIDVGVTKVCIGDLLGNVITSLTENIFKGVEFAMDNTINALINNIGTDVLQLKSYLESLVVSIPKLDLDIPTFFNIHGVKFMIPLWFKILVGILAILTLIFTIISIKTRIVAYAKLPVYGLTSGLTMSIISVIINLYLAVNKSGYDWKITYADNVNLYIAACLLIFISFCVRYIEVYNTNPLFTTKIQIINNSNANDNTAIDEPIKKPNLILNDISTIEGTAPMAIPSITERTLGGGLMNSDEESEEKNISPLSNEIKQYDSPSKIEIEEKAIKIRLDNIDHFKLLNNVTLQIKEDFPSFLILFLMQNDHLNFHGNDVQTTLNKFLLESETLSDLEDIKNSKKCEGLTSEELSLELNETEMAYLYEILWFKIIRLKMKKRLSLITQSLKNNSLIGELEFTLNFDVPLITNHWYNMPSLTLEICDHSDKNAQLNFNEAFQLYLWTYLKLNNFKIDQILHNIIQSIIKIEDKREIPIEITTNVIHLSPDVFSPSHTIVDLLYYKRNNRFNVKSLYMIIKNTPEKNKNIQKFNNYFRESK